jgi:MEMO1 family protein
VTLYKNGQIRGSAGNIKEISVNLGEEIVKNTIEALVADTRFGRVTAEEKGMISLRLDIIKDRKVIDEKTMKTLDPVKF